MGYIFLSRFYVRFVFVSFIPLLAASVFVSEFFLCAILYIWTPFLIDSLRYSRDVKTCRGREYFPRLESTHLCAYKIVYRVSVQSPELVDVTDDKDGSRLESTGKRTMMVVGEGQCMLWSNWLGQYPGDVGGFDVRFLPPETQQELKPKFVYKIKQNRPELASRTINIISAEYITQKRKTDLIPEDWGNYGRNWN